MSIVDSLNLEQRAAAMHLNGPLLVNAGPGTGKTQTLAARIAYLVLEKRIDPTTILAVTFTNQAANEMKRRVERFLAGGMRKEGAIGESRLHQGVIPCIQTLHAFAYRFLSGIYGTIDVADAETQVKILEEALKDLGVKIASREFPSILQALSIIKNQSSLDFEWPVIEKVFSTKDLCERYEQKLREQGQYDFDGMIREMYFLLKEDPASRAKEQTRFQFILVDEFQDLTPLQVALIDLLAASHRNLWVIGDPDQAIYSWRGSSSKLMIHFDDRYLDSKIVILKQNYRNPASILKPANRLIQRNQDRLPKALQSVKEKGEKVRLWTMDDEVTGRWAVQQILESFFGGISSMASADMLDNERKDIGFHEVAILFRKQKEGAFLRTFLEEKGFPVHLSCEKNPIHEKPLAEFVILAHLLLYPEDDRWLYRFLRSLPDFPEAYAEEWFLASRDKKQLLYAVIAEKIETQALSSVFREFLVKIMGFLETAESKLNESFQSFWAFAEAAYWPLLGLKFRDQERLAHFLPSVQLFFAEPGRGALKQLLSQMETQHEPEPDIVPQKIQLLTLHASKGLEFKKVIMVGLEEGNFPVKKAETLEQLEEERRLMYVGMTRAIEELHLVTVKNRRGEPVLPSCFLSEIPEEFLVSGGFSDWYLKQQKNRKKKLAQPSLF
ncbi:ATP-dependent helicase [Candidatus Peregrinibacteria bacterium]|nr:ATP-dependent helicase [Candidatus Peregrinibacteria bacterium]